MTQMKRLTALLMVCLSLCLCACANTNDPQGSVQGDALTYTVTVEDELGMPIPGVVVLLCLDTQMPAITDMQGTAYWTAAQGAYTVRFSELPEGYDYATDVHEFYFDDDSNHLTLTLMKMQ